MGPEGGGDERASSFAVPGAFPTARWCRSRRHGAICTRPRGHVGLHNRQGTGAMWSDLQADDPSCRAAGSPAVAAETLADGFPGGRALCPACGDFVTILDGVLAPHDAYRGARDPDEARARATWFNSIGWNPE